MKTALVTGAGGYLGIHLCKNLLDSKYKVVGLDRYFFGLDKINEIKSHKNFTVVVEDTRYFDHKLMKDVDVVIDLAGLSNDASSEIDPKLTQDINYRGSLNVFEAANKHGVSRYVYASSAAVYGQSSKKFSSEDDDLNPQTEYAKSKEKVEKAILPPSNSNMEVVVLRLSTLYGLAPRMRFDLAINIMTMRAWKHRVIYIMGGGEQWRPFLHVKDASRAFIAAMNADSDKIVGQVFNVGDNSQNFRIKQLAAFVTDVIPNVAIHQIPDDPDKRSYSLSFKKIKEALGFEITCKIHEGIVEIKHALESGLLVPEDPTAHTLNWYKSLIEWEQRIDSLQYKGKVL